jgi:glycosyltransferase involved in cell wall biosynthesis
VREAELLIARPIQRALVAPLALAKVVIANSESTSRWLTSNLPVLRKRIRVVYNGFDLPPATALPHRTDRLRLTLVGRLSPRKGSDVAVDAVALLTREGYDVELDVVGDVFRGYEWYADELHTSAQRQSIDDRVHMRGFEVDAASAYARADIVVVPSRVEPFGNVAVEAMGARRPLVATRVGGLSEIVDDGVTGLLVEPDSPRELADAVRRLADDPALAARLATAGEASVRERFGMDRFTAAFRAALDAAATSGADRVTRP